MLVQNGLLHYDTPVGILCTDSTFAKPIGQLRNPLTFDFPIACKVLKGVNVTHLFDDPHKHLEAFVQAAKELEAEGVRAIVGSCGFMAVFQEAVSCAVKVPVCMSALIQLPLIETLHGKTARIGVLTANAPALTKAHFLCSAVDEAFFERLYIKGMETSPYFRQTIIESANDCMDTELLAEEIAVTAEKMVKEHGLDALLFECTDLCAFGQRVQKRIGIPVYDINALIEYMAFCVRRKPYIHPYM